MNDIVMSTNTPAPAQSSDLIFNYTKQQQDSDNENDKATQESESTLSQSQESPEAENKPTDFTAIMMARWKKSVATELTSNDKEDALIKVNPQSDSADMKQGEPEYAQQCYLRMRATEEAYAISNYFEST